MEEGVGSRAQNQNEDVSRLTPAGPGLARAHELVMAHGRNTTAYQILNPGFTYWFGRNEEAVVAYVRRGSWLLAAGEPVCAPGDLSNSVDEFEAFARNQHCRVCYVCAEENMRRVVVQSMEHAAITLGAQPVWDPGEWPNILRTRSSLRAQLHRSLNKGVHIESMSPADGASDREIRLTLHEWVESRPLPPMHFLVETEVLSGVIDDRVLLVARRDGRVVAFLIASPVIARNGYLIEEIARSHRAPNGTSELLIDAAMRKFAAEGRTWTTMGLVALASGTAHDNPIWLRAIMNVARAHANRFYNFRGLESFRAKMHPAAWEKVHIISNERRFSPEALYAIGGAFSGISPIVAIALAAAKGIQEELRTLGRKLSR